MGRQAERAGQASGRLPYSRPRDACPSSGGRQAELRAWPADDSPTHGRELPAQAQWVGRPSSGPCQRASPLLSAGVAACLVGRPSPGTTGRESAGDSGLSGLDTERAPLPCRARKTSKSHSDVRTPQTISGYRSGLRGATRTRARAGVFPLRPLPARSPPGVRGRYVLGDCLPESPAWPCLP